MDESMNMPISTLMVWGILMYLLCIPKKTLSHYLMLLWGLFVSIVGIMTISWFNIELNFHLKIFAAGGSYLMIMYVFWAFHKEVKRLQVKQNTDTQE